MTIFDLRARVARAVLSWGGFVDPATYVAAHPTSATTSNTISWKPDGSRGPFMAFGLQRSAVDPITRQVLSVEARRITPTPVAFNAICHLSDFTGQGIDISAWPAPLFIEQGQSLNLYEEVVNTGGSISELTYALCGFHTDLESFRRVMLEYGELRAWCVEVAPAAAVGGGNASDRYTLTERCTLVEYLQTLYTGSVILDSLTAKLDDRTIIGAERVGTTSIGVTGPVRMGIPASYLGTDAEVGQTLIVSERVSSSARRDAYTWLAVVRP